MNEKYLFFYKNKSRLIIFFTLPSVSFSTLKETFIATLKGTFIVALKGTFILGKNFKNVSRQFNNMNIFTCVITMK